MMVYLTIRVVLKEWFNHRYGGGRIANCAETAWKCCNHVPGAQQSKLASDNSAQIVNSDRQSNSCHWQLKTWNSCAKVFASCHMGPMNMYTKFVCWTGPTCGDQRLWQASYSGMAWSHLLFWMKTKSDVLICGQLSLTDCLGACCHVIIMWLSGLIRARRTFCGYP